ncbi:membrane protein insertion efficiency factor YidD [Candidatus Dojkabacteria bacterium]|nr:membrane protein insertion efficiency factor YidD [Candidatus Dojkabacteria bacterium]
MRNLVIKTIALYQKTLSFDHAIWANPDRFRVCIYQPSCSEYTKIAVERFGTIRGLWMGFLRVLSCNPFNRPAFDPVPDKPYWVRAIIKKRDKK